MSGRLLFSPPIPARPRARRSSAPPVEHEQLTLNFAHDAQHGRWAPSEPPDDQSGVRPATAPQNGAYAAALLGVRDCTNCGAELSAGDLRHNRQQCVPCRERREQDLAAERSFAAGLTGKASKCACLRWSITENGDGPRHCIKCGLGLKV